MTSYYQMTEWMRELGTASPRQDSIRLWNSDRSLGIAYPEDGAFDLSVFMNENKIVIPRVTSRPADTAPITCGGIKNGCRGYWKITVYIYRQNLMI